MVFHRRPHTMRQAEDLAHRMRHICSGSGPRPGPLPEHGGPHRWADLPVGEHHYFESAGQAELFEDSLHMCLHRRFGQRE